jgi:hypothetical protein
VRYYFDGSNNPHGFLSSNGRIHIIDVPAAAGTLAFGINPQGDIVGLYFDDGGAWFSAKQEVNPKAAPGPRGDELCFHRLHKIGATRQDCGPTAPRPRAFSLCLDIPKRCDPRFFLGATKTAIAGLIVTVPVI